LDRIDPSFRDRAPRLQHHDTLGDVMLIDNGQSLVPYWLVAAAGRPTAEVVYPSVGMLLCNHPDVDYQRACFQAYNRWIAEFCDHAPDRLVGIGQTALRTPEEGVADLEAMHALGL